MVNHINSFFLPLTKLLEGKCEFGIYRNDKPTYINLKAANGTCVAVAINTRFEPKNTVRIQFFAQGCPGIPEKQAVSLNELSMIEEALSRKILNNVEGKPLESSHNKEYRYYRILFPFITSPDEVLNDVANNLITIFNVINK